MSMQWTTSDFPTITTLILHKHQVLGIDRTNPRRAVFSFELTTKLKIDLGDLETGKLLVNPLEFWAAERRVKRLLYS